MKKLWMKIGIFSICLFFIGIIFLVTLIGAIIHNFDRPDQQYDTMQSCGKLVNVSDKVLRYKDLVEKELKRQGVDKKYTSCFLAQMMQESGGTPPNVFQVSGKVETVEESVKLAVQMWNRIAKEIAHHHMAFSVDLIWQTYNFGMGYLDWLEDTGQTYSLDSAFSYSSMMYTKFRDSGMYHCHFAEQKGVACYGDFMYVPHIKRYLAPDKDSIKGDFGLPFVDIPFVVTSEYGKRGSEFHPGIDLVAYFGAPVSSIGDGEVVASLPSSESGGYGEMVTIKHSNGLYSRYGHMDKRYVKKGDKVKKGQVIGTQGNTGDSTGTHLHFEIRTANDYDDKHTINPREYFTFP